MIIPASYIVWVKCDPNNLPDELLVYIKANNLFMIETEKRIGIYPYLTESQAEQAEQGIMDMLPMELA